MLRFRCWSSLLLLVRLIEWLVKPMVSLAVELRADDSCPVVVSPVVLADVVVPVPVVSFVVDAAD